LFFASDPLNNPTETFYVALSEPLTVTHTSSAEEPGRYTAGIVLLEEIQ
jgi:hypothetical protein